MTQNTAPENSSGQPFFHGSQLPWHELGHGIRRKVLSYDANVMLVHVDFTKGAIGIEHQHPHLQCTLIESGVFDVTIGGKTQRLSAGDTVFVPTNLRHGVVAIEAGRLLDSFTPMREDFL
ncbi:MAG: cupin domain-containing protein [Bosea sp. (in: a-proteobacteria)]